MANSYIKTIAVERNGRQYDIVVNGKVVEGGFFHKQAAYSAAEWWRRNYREEEKEQNNG